MKHTEGPWTRGRHPRPPFKHSIWGDDGNVTVASLGDCSVADLNLIAAAPDLLAACQMLLEWCGLDDADGMNEARAEAEGERCAEVFRATRAAIDKAAGTS